MEVLIRHEKSQIISACINLTLKNSQKRAGFKKCRIRDKGTVKWEAIASVSLKTPLCWPLSLFNLPLPNSLSMNLSFVPGWEKIWFTSQTKFYCFFLYLIVHGRIFPGGYSREDNPGRIFPGGYYLVDIPGRIIPGGYSQEDIPWRIFPGG